MMSNMSLESYIEFCKKQQQLISKILAIDFEREGDQTMSEKPSGNAIMKVDAKSDEGKALMAALLAATGGRPSGGFEVSESRHSDFDKMDILGEMFSSTRRDTGKIEAMLELMGYTEDEPLEMDSLSQRELQILSLGHVLGSLSTTANLMAENYPKEIMIAFHGHFVGHPLAAKLFCDHHGSADAVLDSESVHEKMQKTAGHETLEYMLSRLSKGGNKP